MLKLVVKLHTAKTVHDLRAVLDAWCLPCCACRTDCHIYVLIQLLGSGSLTLPPLEEGAFTPGLVRLVERCLHWQPADRPSFREVLHALENEYKVVRGKAAGELFEEAIVWLWRVAAVSCITMWVICAACSRLWCSWCCLQLCTCMLPSVVALHWGKLTKFAYRKLCAPWHQSCWCPSSVHSLQPCLAQTRPRPLCKVTGRHPRSQLALVRPPRRSPQGAQALATRQRQVRPSFHCQLTRMGGPRSRSRCS